MRGAFIVCGALLIAACGGQDSAGPCVLKLNVFDIEQAQVGIAVPVDLELSVRSGSCSVPTNANVIWDVENSNVAEIISFTNTTAMVRGKKAGSTFIKAWLALAPSTRDSATFTAFVPTDQ